VGSRNACEYGIYFATLNKCLSTNSTKKIFVNLPVKDLPRAKEFFGKLGFDFNAQFIDDTGACMVVSDQAYVMLLTHAKFKAFAANAIADATKPERCNRN
jgi:predicted lactoylglutathione lyase